MDGTAEMIHEVQAATLPNDTKLVTVHALIK